MKDRYIIQKSKSKPGFSIVIDTKFGIVVEFHEGYFNDSKKVTMHEDIKDLSIEIQKAMTEIEGWLYANHYGLLFNRNNKEIMSEEEIKSRIMACDDTIQGVIIKSTYGYEEDTMLAAWLDVIFPDGMIPMIAIITINEDYIFTPYDWYGYIPKTFEEIGGVAWRINASEHRAIVINGLPRILTKYIPTIKDQTRRNIGMQIKKAREALGLTVRQLAERCCISYNHISRIEQGRYNVAVDTLAIVGKVLGIEIKI